MNPAGGRATEILMTSKDGKEPAENQGARKPRGMGGVILILALLMALFLVVSSNGRDSAYSVSAFYHYLFNGRVTGLTFSGGVAKADIVGDDDKPTQVEVVVRDLVGSSQESLMELYQSLQAQRLDPSLYGDRIQAFLDDFDGGKVFVQRAFFVQEAPSKQPGQGAANDQRTPANYMTLLLLRDSKVHYVRFNPAATGPSLQQLTQALTKAGVPIRTHSQSVGNDFRISEPNTALIYILGTVGPWILVLAIVWFFILRQMRAPGGTGGVLSFGRSRASLYTKENRTNVTFDDVAGMEEAKAEVREIIEFLKNPAKFARLGGSIPRGVLLGG